MYHKSKSEVGSRKAEVRRLLVTLLILVVASTIVAQEGRRNVEVQKLKNPEASNAETLDAGKKVYARYCASCHGPNGKGDGGMALSGGTPSDLTDETWDYGSTDGEIFVAIKDGVSADMLAYKDKLNDKQIWQIVLFLRSLGPKAKESK